VALIGNYSVVLKSPGKFGGGVPPASLRGNFGGSSAARARRWGCENKGYARTANVPGGYRPPYSLEIAQTDGEIASFTQIRGVPSVTANGACGMYIASAVSAGGDVSSVNLAALGHAISTITGSSTVTTAATALGHAISTIAAGGNISEADVFAALNAAATLSGSGNISNADLVLVVSILATLTGSGSLVLDAVDLLLSAQATLSGSSSLSADAVMLLHASATLTASGDLVGAIAAIGHAVADIVGSSTTAAQPYATGDMGAAISSSSSTEISNESVARAVWESLAAAFTSDGTMGALLNSAGSGGMDPALVAKIVDLWRLAGLDPTKPLTVTSAGDGTGTRAAGTAIVQSITETGTPSPAGSATVTRTT
jgi:hypothetical protein